RVGRLARRDVPDRRCTLAPPPRDRDQLGRRRRTAATRVGSEAPAHDRRPRRRSTAWVLDRRRLRTDRTTPLRQRVRLAVAQGPPVYRGASWGRHGLVGASREFAWVAVPFTDGNHTCYPAVWS